MDIYRDILYRASSTEVLVGSSKMKYNKTCKKVQKVQK